jgi:hypothetical protein
MKNLLRALLASVLLWSAFANAAPQMPDNLQGSKVTAISYMDDNSSGSMTLVPGVSGQSVTLYKYIVSVSAADYFYLKCGTSQKTSKVYLGANSGLDNTIFPLYIRCASGEALTLVKGNPATPLGITLWFTQAP